MIENEAKEIDSTRPTVVDQGTQQLEGDQSSESQEQQGGSGNVDGAAGEDDLTGDLPGDNDVDQAVSLPPVPSGEDLEVQDKDDKGPDTALEAKDPAPVVNVEVKTAAPEVKETLEVKPVEVKAPVVEVKEEVKQTVSTTVKTEAAAAPVTHLDQLKAKIAESGSPAAKKLVDSLEAYLTNMRPGLPLTSEKGNQQQQSLWFLIRNTVESSKPEDFRQLWHTILMYFNHHKTGALGPRHLFRFAESWSRGQDELRGFQKVLNIIRLTADPAERESGLKQVDIAANLQDGFSEEGRSRLVQYYKG